MQPGDKEWSETPTASQFGAMLGVDPYKSRPKVWAESTGNREDLSGQPAIEHGKTYEPVAIELFTKQTGILTYDYPDTYINKEGFGATPDALTVDGGGAEAKCPYSQHDFTNFGPDTGANGIDFRYFPQIYGNMHVFETDFWYFVVFIIDNDKHGLRVWRVERSDRYITEMMRLLKAFKQNYWGNAFSPPPKFSRKKENGLTEKQRINKMFSELIITPERIL